MSQKIAHFNFVRQIHRLQASYRKKQSQAFCPVSPKNIVPEQRCKGCQKMVVEEVYSIQEQWVGLKRSVTSPGLSFSEVSAMDIFDFFTVLRDLRRKEPQQ